MNSLNESIARYGLFAFGVVCAVLPLLLRLRGRWSTLASALALFATTPSLYAGAVHARWIRETYFRFMHATALMVLPLLVFVVVDRLVQGQRRAAPLRQALTMLAAVLALSSALLAVAEPELGRLRDRMTVVIAIDRSRSIELVPSAEARIAAELKLAQNSMRARDRIGIVAFGSDARTEEPPRSKSDPSTPQRVDVGRETTDIERAIRRSLADIPSDSAGRVVLITDGIQTRGNALAATATAIGADVPIDAIVLEQARTADVRVVSVRAPNRVNEKEAFDLRVVTESPEDTDIELRISRDGLPLHAGRARIAKGEDVLRVREIADVAGMHRYDVAITSLRPELDTQPEDNIGTAFVRVRGETSVLVLEGDLGKGAPFVRTLSESGLRAEERSLANAPADIGEFARFDLVILSDIRASDFSRTQVDALASYVRDLGGGLLLMGGDRSMGPGGYARTAIEEVAPVRFDLKTEKRRASLAEVIAIDYSGSMSATVGGHTKLALANEGAARSASLLGTGDRLGVEHVDTSVAWTVPMDSVEDATKVAAKIRAVQVGGGGIYTNIALDAGYGALDKESVNLKHLLLFADGGDAEQIAGCRAKVQSAYNRGITTSVISIGRGSDTPELEVLSRIGHGRFYLVEDATKLPAIFSQETVLASKSALSEQKFRISLGSPGPAIRNIDWNESPELLGYVITVAKPRANVHLAGPEADPILASWPVGLGRSAVFASDYKDRWGSAWLKWAGAAKMFVQLARELARRDDDPRVRLESDASAGTLRIRADVVGDDGRTQSFRRLRALIAGPDGYSQEVPLEALAPGRYGASLPLSRAGTYVAALRDEGSGESLGVAGCVLSIGDELRPTGSDRALLQQIAMTTRGKLRPTLAGLFDDRTERRFSYSALGPALALLSAILLLLSVASRRLGMPEALAVWFDHAAVRRAEARTRARERRAEYERQAALHADEQRKYHDALRVRKERTGHAPPPMPPAPGHSHFSNLPNPAPRTDWAPSVATPQVPEMPAKATDPVTTTRTAPPVADRPLTVAERRALRRREKK